MKPVQPLQTEQSGKVRAASVSDGSGWKGSVSVVFSSVGSRVGLMLCQDEHHLDHATDEEKLASSVGLRSDKEDGGG